MNSKRLLIALTVGAIGVTSIAGAGIALADDGTPGPGPQVGFMRGGHGPAEGRGPANTTEPGVRQDQMHQAAATALGISVDELEAQLAEGKTVARIATERGVDLATVQAAMRDERPAGAHAGRMAGNRAGDCPYSTTN